MTFNEKVKLTARYVVVAFICYLAYMVTSIEYINTFDNKEMVLNVIVGSVFGALTLVLKFHFDTKVEK